MNSTTCNNNIHVLPDGSGFFTETILSKEEAMNLPIKERPLNYRISSDLYHTVFESIGSASMCWHEGTGNKVFNAEQASKVAVNLCFKIAEEIENKSLTKFENYFNEQMEWANATFTKANKHSILTHLRRELIELENSDNDAEEYADCFMLLLHYANKMGLTPESILASCKSKLEKNKSRKWKAPDEHGVCHHVKDNN